MRDLTQGPVIRHLLHMAAFVALSLLVQALYLLADLYFIGTLGREAIAAVGVAGNLTMIVMALSQTLGVGTTALLAQAAGRKDQPHAEWIFNQSFVMSLLVGAGFAIAGFLLRDAYCNALSADAVTAQMAKQYLNWFVPAMALLFTMVTLNSALRASAVMKPAVAFQILSVALNIMLAPVFIFGVGPVPPMGVTGAALATFTAILISNVLLLLYFDKRYHYVRLRVTQSRPQFAAWWSVLKIGLPAGAEFGLFAIYALVVYVIIRPFGAAAQAGFGIGRGVTQTMYLPVLALSFAVGPMVGQNFGGRFASRVRHTVYAALGLASAMMLVLTIVAWLMGPALIRPFSGDPDVIAFGGEYLMIMSLNFVAAGIAFSSSSVFQGIGNTIPPLLSTVARLLLFALPALWISTMPGFHIRHVWYLSVASQLLQTIFILLLLRRELRRKLNFTAPAEGPSRV
jgi:putative MATE family efflux protein